jgi:ribonuclease T2
MHGMLKWFSPLALGLLLALPVPARTQDFDYWLLALSWSPSWCLGDGAGDAEQCDPSRDLGFTLHGLWPQYEDGWPEYCETDARDPSRRQTAAMADIMGSGGLAWYQWKKHGRCSGLAADGYFAAARRLYGALNLAVPDAPRASAAEIEAALLAANPALGPDAVIVTCGDGRLAEVRICLSPEFAPRRCAPDVERDACRTRGPLDLPSPP